MSARAHWLLDIEIDGQVHRWAEQAVSVTQASGTVLSYAVGLADLALAQGSNAPIAVADKGVDWATLAPQLEGRACTLRRWIEGTAWEQAEVYSVGEATGTAYGSRDEPVTWTIAPRSGAASLGTQVPDPLAVIGYSTWPIGGAGFAPGSAGPYPVLFGYPGYIAEAATSVAVMPAPLAQWPLVPPDGAHTYVLLSEDAAAPITSCTIRNNDPTVNAQATEAASVVTDLLGRRVVVANFSSSAVPRPSASTQLCFAGFTPSGGGGVARSAYDVIVYLLRRWGSASVDWARLPEVADVLAPFLVDTWIDSPQPDPWAWIEQLVADLPVEIRTSTAGRYLVAKRYVSDPTRQILALSADLGQVVRTSAVSRSGSPVNEITAYYRKSLQGEWLGQVTLSGDSTVLSATAVTAPATTNTLQYVTLARSLLCTRSLQRYGLRTTDPVEIEWSWDTGTIVRCLGVRAERDAMPALMVSYDVPNDERLVEGDEVLLTDSELNWSAVPAIVDAPPERGVSTSVLFRIPTGTVG